MNKSVFTQQDASCGSGTDRHLTPSSTSVSSDLPSALLTIADYYGTLAAARHLGQLGIPVVVGDSSRLAPAIWSKFVTRRESTPPVTDTSRFVEWLVKFGASNPNYVLYPTSDETAWLYAYHQEELKQFYHLYAPEFSCLYRILNKQLLADACQALGICTPETHFPNSIYDVECLAKTIKYPVIIKPKTQVFLSTHVKGRVVNSAVELVKAYEAFVGANYYPQEMSTYDESIRWPMIQTFYAEADQGIYSISGFIDRTGELFATRASRKILQHPRRVGVGLCFQQAEVDPKLWAQLLSLCRKLGYFGVFEVEFIPSDSGQRHVLTDFNPRYYNQMQFDIDRGLALPELAYYAAINEPCRLSDAINAATQDLDNSGARTYCYKHMFRLMLNSQRLSRSLSRSEFRAWHQWFLDNRGWMSDPLCNPTDRNPALVNMLMIGMNCMRHPKGFVKSIVLNR